MNLHAGQSKVYDTLFVSQTSRFATVCCSRGWGKSYLMSASAVTACWELMELDSLVPNKNVYVIAPTHDQVTDIYYPILAYEMGLESVALKSSRDLGRFLFPSNVELRLLSYESVERVRGKGAYFIGWDEVSSCRKGMDPKDAWESVLSPCVTTRWSPQMATSYGARSPGRALFVGTPQGFNFFYDLYNMPETDSRWWSLHQDYTQSPYLDKDEIESLRHSMDPIRFASEYLASFQDSGNSVFYCFDRKTHVRDVPSFSEGEDVHVAIDFNVGLQCSSAFAVRGGQMHILEEYQGHPDTETLAVSLATRYKGHKIYAYPDPSGRARKTSAPVGRTDFSILESHGIRCLAHNRTIPVIDGVNAVNRMLKTAAGSVNLYVSPKCRRVIESLERTKWVDGNPNTAAIDKSEGVEHFSDGIRYAAEYLFPVLTGSKSSVRGFSF